MEENKSFQRPLKLVSIRGLEKLPLFTFPRKLGNITRSIFSNPRMDLVFVLLWKEYIFSLKVLVFIVWKF